MTIRLRRPVIFAVALLSLIEWPALAGWKIAGVGPCDGGSLTVDSAGTTHLLCSRTLNRGSELLYYLTYSPKGGRGPLLVTRSPVPSPYVVLSPVVRKVSHAMPAGSSIQDFSDLA